MLPCCDAAFELTVGSDELALSNEDDSGSLDVSDETGSDEVNSDKVGASLNISLSGVDGSGGVSDGAFSLASGTEAVLLTSSVAVAQIATGIAAKISKQQTNDKSRFIFLIRLAPANHAGCRFAAANTLVINILLVKRDAA